MAIGEETDPVVFAVNGTDGNRVPEPHQRAHTDNVAGEVSNLLKAARAVHAKSPLAGQPGGFLAVEISESSSLPQGVHIKVKEQVSHNPIPKELHVPSCGKILFSAIGGDGEPGHIGIDEELGRPSSKGSPTAHSRDEGRSQGSSGGNGGPGGSIRIYVNGNETHLLACMAWNVRGGDAGGPGQHCKSRRRRFAAVDYSKSADATNTAASTKLDSCRCHDDGVCALCKPKPLSPKSSSLGEPQDDKKTDWQEITDRLLPGLQGSPGSVDIVVKTPNRRSFKRYQSCYHLELVGFDVEDENNDGIFEPGETLYIRRIQIANRGGMPSPSRPIPIAVRPSDGISPIEDSEAALFVTKSILPNETLILDGVLRARVLLPNVPHLLETVFRQNARISLLAKMPWINRTLDGFSLFKTIDIGFPLRIESVLVPKAMETESKMELEYIISNVSSKPTELTHRRVIEVSLPIQSETGEISTRRERDRRVLHLPPISPGGSHRLRQIIRFPYHDRYSKNSIVSFALCTSSASGQSPHQASRVPISEIKRKYWPIQKVDIALRDADADAYKPEADVIVITNPGVRKSDLHRLTKLIESQLGLTMGTWNVAYRNGLGNFMDEVKDRLMIVFCNEFGGPQDSAETALRYFDISTTSQACAQGSTFLFLGAANDPAFQRLQRNVSFPADVLLDSTAGPNTRTTLAQSGHECASVESLVQVISQNIALGRPRFRLYWTRVSANFFGIAKLQAARATNEFQKLQDLLAQSLPSEQFLVHRIPDAGQDYLVVFHGLPRHATIRATGPDLSPSFSAKEGEEVSEAAAEKSLHRLDEYALIDALPVSVRAGIVWRPGVWNFTLLAQLSLARDIHEELSVLLSRGCSISASAPPPASASAAATAAAPASPASSSSASSSDASSLLSSSSFAGYDYVPPHLAAALPCLTALLHHAHAHAAPVAHQPYWERGLPVPGAHVLQHVAALLACRAPEAALASARTRAVRAALRAALAAFLAAPPRRSSAYWTRLLLEVDAGRVRLLWARDHGGGGGVTKTVWECGRRARLSRVARALAVDGLAVAEIEARPPVVTVAGGRRDGGEGAVDAGVAGAAEWRERCEAVAEAGAALLRLRAEKLPPPELVWSDDEDEVAESGI